MSDTSQPSPAQKFEQAIRLIKSGNKDQGRALLIEVLNANPKNDQAWLWMAEAVDTADLRQECLQEALKINPRNRVAQLKLAELAAPYNPSSDWSHYSTSPQQPTGVVKPVIGSWIVLLVLSLFFLAQIPLLHDVTIVLAVADTSQLQTVTAEVTEYQTTRLKGKTSYQLRYRFQIAGRSQWYTAPPLLFEESNPWRLMTVESWQAAKQQGDRLQVLYRLENPGLNRAVGELAIDPVGTLAIWGWVTLFNVVALWEIHVARRNHSRCRTVAEEGGICRMRYWQVKRV